MILLARLACMTFALATVNAFAAEVPVTAKPVPRDAKWMKTHEAILARMNKGNVDVLFVGDSITAGWGGNGKKVWENDLKAWKPGNLGIGGDRTEHVLWRITEGKEIEHVNPKVVVLMIGTNNTGANSAEEIAAGIKAIVEKFREKKPQAKILLLGVFPRNGSGNKEAAEIEPTQFQPKIKAINDLIAKFDDGKSVHYLDIGKSFLNAKGNLPKATMPDYLHLSADGYAKWAAAIKEPVDKLLK